MSEILRFPALLFSFAVDRVRHLPGARVLGPATAWLARLCVLAAIVLLALWAAEVSPQRISLADLAAGKLGQFQTWIIVSGELGDEVQGSSASLRMYHLTDPAAQNAFLEVRSEHALAPGWTTLSGHIEGGREAVPVGYAWSARLDADPTLAPELPPPWTSIALLTLAVVIMLARRSSYPMFVPERPMDVPPPTSALRVLARADPREHARDATETAGTLSFTSEEPGAADLAIMGRRTLPIRLHSAFTRVDVGRLRSLGASRTALRVRSDDDDLVLLFASARERDSAFAALQAETQLRRAPRTNRPPDRGAPDRGRAAG